MTKQTYLLLAFISTCCTKYMHGHIYLPTKCHAQGLKYGCFWNTMIMFEYKFLWRPATSSVLQPFSWDSWASTFPGSWIKAWAFFFNCILLTHSSLLNWHPSVVSNGRFYATTMLLTVTMKCFAHRWHIREESTLCGYYNQEGILLIFREKVFWKELLFSSMQVCSEYVFRFTDFEVHRKYCGVYKQKY